MDDLETPVMDANDEIDSLDDSIARVGDSMRRWRNRRLFASVIRWSLMIALIVLAFRTYPIIGWILVAFVPLELWGLYRIFSMTGVFNGLQEQMESTRSRIQSIYDAADRSDERFEENVERPRALNRKPSPWISPSNGTVPKSSPTRPPN